MMFSTSLDKRRAEYPIELPVQFETCGRSRLSGVGRTLAVSRQVIRFACDRALPTDEKIRLVLAWPVMLPDGAGLNLWIVGKVTRSVLGEVQIQVVSYEFRTRRGVQGEQASSSAAARNEPAQRARTMAAYP